MRLTKIEIIKSPYDQLGMSKKDCIRIVDRLFEIVKDGLVTS